MLNGRRQALSPCRPLHAVGRVSCVRVAHDRVTETRGRALGKTCICVAAGQSPQRAGVLARPKDAQVLIADARAPTIVEGNVQARGRRQYRVDRVDSIHRRPVDEAGTASQVCPAAPGAGCVNGAAICGLDALPNDVACSGAATCSMLIDPCPNWKVYSGVEETDGYVCQCISNAWSCAKCAMGAGICMRLDAATGDASCDVNTLSTVVDCPSVAAVCPCGCRIAGQPQRYDRAQQCLQPPSPDVVVCTRDGTSDAAIGCWARVDTGDLYFFGGLPVAALFVSGSVWRECTPSESILVLGDGGLGVPPCPPSLGANDQ